MRRLLALPVALFVGTLLAQAAWLVSVPAFRGIDEFDHAYRAASVARGEWRPSGEVAADGRGELVTVPRDLVAAAGPECSARPYTGPDNCRPVDDDGQRQVQVATAASRYHPAYYWVVGEAARGAHGTSALLVMRWVSAVVCAAFAALAGWAVSRWARTRWPVVALLACLTPVLVYSGIVVAPNAVEIFAALSVWVALAGLAGPARHSLTRRVERSLLVAAVPGAVVLATVRSLGLGWLGLCVLVVLGVLGPARSLALVRRHRGTLAACTGVVGLAALAAVGWLAAVRPNQLESHADNQGALAGSLIQVPVWVLQTVAAAPGRSDPAPGVVYLLCGAGLLALVVAGLRVATRRVRTATMVVAVLSVAGPFALTLMTYRDVGVIWQGRYGLPLSLGVTVLCGLALDGVAWTRRGAVAVAAGGALFVAGHVVAVLAVLDQQRRVSPSVAAGLWHPPSAWLVLGLTLLGWAVLAGGLLARSGAADASLPEPAAPGRAAQERLVT